MERLPRLVLWSDFCCPTGFARVGETIADSLQRQWDIAVLAINFHGDHHPLSQRYRLYPAFMGGDKFGIDRLGDIIRVEQPDAVLMIQDAWNIAKAIKHLGPEHPPLVAYVPVDGTSLRRADVAPLNACAAVVAYTAFGRRELWRAGLTAPCAVIPHGIDLDTFRPVDQAETRRRVGLDEDTYAVLVLDRNQVRKRLDIAFEAFARFAADKGPNVRLIYHGQVHDVGWDIPAMAEDLGIADRLILTTRDAMDATWRGVALDDMAAIYSLADVKLSTSSGEGWGLCVSPDTWITTDRGIIPMRNVQVNDFVIAEDGHWHQIRGKISRMAHILHITIQGTPRLTITPEHPFYRLPKRSNPREYYQRHPLDGLAWVRADELVPGDFVAMPRPQWHDALPNAIDLAGWAALPGVSYDETSIWCDMGYSGISSGASIRTIQQRYGVSKRVAEDARRVALGAITERRGGVKSVAARVAQQIAADGLVLNTEPLRVHRYIPVDDQFLTFVGWYLAEGSTDATCTRVEFDFCRDELPIAEALAAYVAETFGLTARVDINGPNKCRLRIASRILAALMDALCGRGAYHKRLHPLFSQAADKLAPLIAAYISGDGYQDARGNWRVSTASTELAWQFRSICAVAGIFVAIAQREHNGSLIWDLSIGGDASARLSAWTGLVNNADVTRQRALSVLVSDHFLFIPVRSIEDDDDGGDQEVMDISVANTHSFMGNGVLLHNTTMEAMACGVPTIVPDYAALGEWAQGAVRYVPISYTLRHTGGINTVGGIVDVGDMAEALEQLYQAPAARARLAQAGLALVREPQYRWEAIAAQFDALLRGAVEQAAMLELDAEVAA